MKWKERFTGLLFWVIKRLVSLRYAITVEGLDSLNKKSLNRGGGIMFLPNHPAELDPVMMMLLLWKKFHPRPLVVEHFYYLSGIQFFIRFVKALPLPNLNGSTNKWKVKQVEKSFNQVADELNRKENFLIYPAGKLKLEAGESLGGASLVHHLIQACPDVNIVLIRTTGLWGSRFSRALTGKVPDFGSALFQGFKILLKNGIFFTPRRKIKIEVMPAPPDFPYRGTRLQVNRYLEEWYNRVPDSLTLISSCFWKKEVPTVHVPKKSEKEKESLTIPPQLEKEILEKLSKLTHRPSEKLNKEMHLYQDLGLDSLDLAELSAFLDEKYEVVDLAPGELQTVQDLLNSAAGGKREKQHAAIKKTDLLRWHKEKSRLKVQISPGDTLQEVFLHSCDRMGGAIACADALSGILTYRKLKCAALVLSLKLRHIPGKCVGVLLPSSVGAYVVILACLLAKKIPVMLNWTAGVRSLDHAAQVTDLQTVLSAYRFLSRLGNEELGKIEEKIEFLEELRTSLTWKEKMKGFVLSLYPCRSLLKKLRLERIQPEDPTVILFTSGTEALPKAVPLTHANLLSNQRAALSMIDFKSKDIFYGVLPPFHSFGFSVTGLLPLFAGLKVYYAPDPTDSHGLAEDIAHWKPTLFCSAPGFISTLFRVADPTQLQSIRLFVSGAEKAPPELFDYVDALGGHKILIEGYGITECSPIVTFNLPFLPPQGVGFPLPGIELCTIDSETLDPLPPGEEGEICIYGPNVFPGYLGHQKKSPFLTLEGKKWYRSGDRGFLTQEGALVLSGRLKRFVKVGGGDDQFRRVGGGSPPLGQRKKMAGQGSRRAPFSARGERKRGG